MAPGSAPPATPCAPRPAPQAPWEGKPSALASCQRDLSSQTRRLSSLCQGPCGQGSNLNPTCMDVWSVPRLLRPASPRLAAFLSCSQAAGSLSLPVSTQPRQTKTRRPMSRLTPLPPPEAPLPPGATVWCCRTDRGLPRRRVIGNPRGKGVAAPRLFATPRDLLPLIRGPDRLGPAGGVHSRWLSFPRHKWPGRPSLPPPHRKFCPGRSGARKGLPRQESRCPPRRDAGCTEGVAARGPSLPPTDCSQCVSSPQPATQPRKRPAERPVCGDSSRHPLFAHQSKYRHHCCLFLLRGHQANSAKGWAANGA